MRTIAFKIPGIDIGWVGDSYIPEDPNENVIDTNMWINLVHVYVTFCGYEFSGHLLCMERWDFWGSLDVLYLRQVAYWIRAKRAKP